MKSSTFTGTALNAKLRTSRTSKPARLNLVAAVRKVNTFDSAWEKVIASLKDSRKYSSKDEWGFLGRTGDTMHVY